MAEPRRALGAALLHVEHPRSRPGARERSAALNPTLVLFTACAILFLIGVNTTAINTALNAIADDVGMGSGDLGWAVGIYLIAVAAFVVPAGRLGDRLGEREVMVVGLLVFAGAAVLVAAAADPWMVICGRFLQGVGSAFLMPATMAVLRIAYPPERQGFALGVWGAVGGVAFAVGPLIGGVLTDLASWRWVWWITFAYAAIFVWVTLVAMGGMPRPSARPRIDVAGVVLLPVSLFALILAIQQGPEWGWGAAGTVAAFAISAVGMVSLVVIESRLENPLLHLRLLRIPALAAANLGTLINSMLLIGVLFFFNIYAQAVVTLDYSALGASVALLPYGVCVFGASMVIGRVCDRVGFRWPIAGGLALMGAGALLASRVDASSSYADIWWCVMILGLGVGLTFSAPSAAGLRAVADEHAGEASGIINVVRYLGAALVVTLGTVLFVSAGSDDLNGKLDAAGVPRLEREKLDATLTGAPAQVAATERTLDARDREAFRTGAAEGVAGGFAAVMLGLGIVSLISAPAWVALMRPPRVARE